MKKLFPLIIVLTVLSTASVNGGVIRGEGDFEFYISLSAFPTSDDRVVELIQIAVPVKEITYRKHGDVYKSLLEVEVALLSGGKVAFSKGYRIKDEREEPPRAKDISGFVYLIDSCLVYPGEYVLNATVKDMYDKKAGAVSLFKKSYRSSRIGSFPVSIPLLSGKDIIVSEPVLIWSREKSHFIPNPMSIYGLKKDTLSFYAECLLAASMTADSVTFRAAVLNNKGNIEITDEYRKAVINNKAFLTASLDINTLPAGDYRLVVNVQKDTLVDSRAKDFNVSWELVNWQKPQRELLVEARILLNEKEFELFKHKSLGEQEKMLDELWKKLDPTPHTARNEAFEKFEQRLNYADATFGTFIRGALTDRGITYIRFGPPDEIIKQNVPHNRDDLDQAMEKLTDEFHVVLHSFTARDNMGVSRRPNVQLKYHKDAQSKLIRGFAGQDTGAYELWIYNMYGDPILDRGRLLTVKPGLRFLFVDKDGYGEYSLVGTSEDMFND